MKLKVELKKSVENGAGNGCNEAKNYFFFAG